MYGAQLIDALSRAYARVGTRQLARARAGSESLIHFFGAGGPRMRAVGCDIVVDTKDLAVVGITEILSHLPKIYQLYRRLIREADKRKPDLAIVIDSPAFNWRVARQMKKRGIPTVYYVAPQFWAWRQGRVRLLRDYIDKALVIFPFEEKFYRDRGVDATFIGHPLAELPRPRSPAKTTPSNTNSIPRKHWITLMPGSRRKEVAMNLPAILESAHCSGSDFEFLLPVAPTLDRSVSSSNPPTPNSLWSTSVLPALHHSRAGIIASGTATVEAAMMGTPFVMVYRVTPLTYRLGKSTVKVPHFAMVNLIAGKEVVPELVQHDFTADKVVRELNDILPDGPARSKMLADLAAVKAALRGSSDSSTSNSTAGHATTASSPADHAAQIILKMLRVFREGCDASREAGTEAALAAEDEPMRSHDDRD